MAAPATLSVSSTPKVSCSRELNRVAQQVAWIVINKRLFHREQHKKWHDIFYMLCDSLSLDIATETVHLVILVSLLLKLHTDEDTVRECAQKIVNLLEKLILVPELADFKDELLHFLNEAKCQAVLHCCAAHSNNKEALALLAKYFDDSTDSLNSEVHETLRRLLSGRSTKASIAEMKRFVAEHNVSRFTEDLIKFINSSLTRFKAYNFYNCIEEQFRDFDTNEEFIDGRNEHSQQEEVQHERVDEEEINDEQELLNEEGEMITAERETENLKRGRNDENNTGLDTEQDEGEGKSVPAAPTTAVTTTTPIIKRELKVCLDRSEVEEGMEEEKEYRIEEDVSSDESVLPRIHSKRPRRMIEEDEEELDWDSTPSEVTTPPSHLPERKQVQVRNRQSFLSTTPTKRGWSTIETENLLKGVREFGVGKWHMIMKKYWFATHRTSVSLKDKWRNLQGRRPNK